MIRVYRGKSWRAAFAALFCGLCCAYGQHAVIGPSPSRAPRERTLPGGFPSSPSLPPSASIPVDGLGFSGPGAIYMGERDVVASLDFLDENRLLFTFRVPGLIHREFRSGQSEESDERQIKAVVLKLPSGAVEAESLWTVHDRFRYLWMLRDGHFLFRDKENLLEGDAQLTLKPLLQFPGPLLRVNLDPGEQFLVSNSLEPAATPAKPGTVGSPPTASASVTTDGEGSDDARKDYVVRILRRETGQVMLVSRTRGVVHLPINSEGYVENLRGRGDEWVLNLSYFTGGNHLLGSVNSSCVPTEQFISAQEILVTGCDNANALKFVAMKTDGSILWDVLNPPTEIWPILTTSTGGLRVAEAMLAVTHPVNAYAPLGTDDIKGEMVRVFDAATGGVAFEAPLSPILDGGGDVAISQSGRRVAIINAGAVQVFDLPEPPPLAAAPDRKPAH